MARENSLPRRDRSERRYRDLGIECRREGRFQDAIVYFSCAIKLNPNDPSYYYERGNVYIERGDLESAHSDFEETIRQAPDNAQYQERLNELQHLIAAQQQNTNEERGRRKTT